MLAAAACLAVAAADAGEPLESLSVTYDALSCESSGSTAAGVDAPVQAELVGLSRKTVYAKTIPAVSDAGVFTARFEVVPDAYYVQGQREKTGCSTPGGVVAVVLPGHPVSMKVGIFPCCGDMPAYSYVAGLVSPGIDVRLLRSSAPLSCEARVDESTLDALQGAESFRRAGNAYYGSVADASTGTLVFELTRGGRNAFVHLVLQPNGSISDESTFKRLDATIALFDRAGGRATLFCPV